MIGLPNLKINAPEQQVFQGIMTQRPIPPDCAMIGIPTHGDELMDYTSTVNNFHSTNSKNWTLDDAEFESKNEPVLPLTCTEREKACRAIAAGVARNTNIITSSHPNFYFGLSSRLQWQRRMDGFILLKVMSLRACRSRLLRVIGG